MFFSEQSLDDLMHKVYEDILARGQTVLSTKAPDDGILELSGVMLEVTDPRARLSLTETRGVALSCLGELCWYLAGSNDPNFIWYYIDGYPGVEDGKIFGAYGPRLFAWDGINQVQNVITQLRAKNSSKRAVIQIFDRTDLLTEHTEVPCTCTFEFLIRNNQLHMIANMRSHDAFKGMPHDFFCFTMLQEIIARDLGLEMGTYRVSVGSLHLYAKDSQRARAFLAEGWQSSGVMPPMPAGNPWPAIERVLEAELDLRTNGTFDTAIMSGLDNYWQDLIRMLEVFSWKKRINKSNFAKMKAAAGAMSCAIYAQFIEKLTSSAEKALQN